jgi:hypothetical protein
MYYVAQFLREQPHGRRLGPGRRPRRRVDRTGDAPPPDERSPPAGAPREPAPVAAARRRFVSTIGDWLYGRHPDRDLETNDPVIVGSAPWRPAHRP